MVLLKKYLSNVKVHRMYDWILEAIFAKEDLATTYASLGRILGSVEYEADAVDHEETQKTAR